MHWDCVHWDIVSLVYGTQSRYRVALTALGINNYHAWGCVWASRGCSSSCGDLTGLPRHHTPRHFMSLLDILGEACAWYNARWIRCFTGMKCVEIKQGVCAGEAHVRVRKREEGGRRRDRGGGRGTGEGVKNRPLFKRSRFSFTSLLLMTKGSKHSCYTHMHTHMIVLTLQCVFLYPCGLTNNTSP